MKRKDLLTLLDYSEQEIINIIRMAASLKKELKEKKFPKPLNNKTVALIFEKPSLRTHATFETGIVQLGGHALYLPPSNIKIGIRESVVDVAKNLERWVDGIVIRTFSQKLVENLAIASSIPVINALTDEAHPCQALATGLTIKEHFGKFDKLKVAFVGDGNNVASSLLIMCAKLGMNCVHVGPPRYQLPSNYLAIITELSKKKKRTFEYSQDIKSVAKADLIYTDVWTSMGQEAESARRLKIFRKYQVNSALMEIAGPQALFSHCLPAHRGEEVTADVLDSNKSIALDEAENRLHVQKSVLTMLLANNHKR